MRFLGVFLDISIVRCSTREDIFSQRRNEDGEDVGGNRLLHFFSRQRRVWWMKEEERGREEMRKGGENEGRRGRKG